MISVSILGADLETIKLIDNSNCDMIHLDIMDNKFVPNKNEFEIGYRFNKKIDAHLMVEDVIYYLEKYKSINADTVTFHIEVKDDIKKIINKIKSLNSKVGIAINPDSDINLLIPYLNDIDLILIMGVKPGFGGQQFILNTVDRLNEIIRLRDNLNLNFKISVDGGINDETIKLISAADIKVVGSYVTHSTDIVSTIDKIKNLEN